MSVTKLYLSVWVLHFECINFSVCKCEWVFWVTLRVTDECDNHTISNTIQYYWLDCGWVYNEMPRFRYYWKTKHFLLSAWLCVHYSSALVYKMAACNWVVTLSYVEIILIIYADELVEWWWFCNDDEQLRRAVSWAWWSKWESRGNGYENVKQ